MIGPWWAEVSRHGSEAYYNPGVDLDRKGDHEAAVAEFRKALALKPDCAEALIYLGGIMFYKRDAASLHPGRLRPERASQA